MYTKVSLLLVLFACLMMIQNLIYGEEITDKNEGKLYKPVNTINLPNWIRNQPQKNQAQLNSPGSGVKTGQNLPAGGGLISKLSKTKSCFGNGGPITVIIQTPSPPPATTAASG